MKIQDEYPGLCDGYGSFRAWLSMQKGQLGPVHRILDKKKNKLEKKQKSTVNKSWKLKTTEGLLSKMKLLEKDQKI